jgi:hypothetical protein
VTDVFRGVSYLLPHPIDGRRQLRPVVLGLSSQFLNGSCHRVTLLDFFQDELTLISIVPRRDYSIAIPIIVPSEAPSGGHPWFHFLTRRRQNCRAGLKGHG